MGFAATIIGAIAGAIGSAVGAVASFIAGIGAVGRILIGVGMQLAASALRRQKAGKQSITGTRLSVQYGGSRPREICAGTIAIAGQEIFKTAFGNDNENLIKIYLLSDFPIFAVNRVAINGEWCQLTGSNDAERGHGVTGQSSRRISIKLFYGDLDQAASDYVMRMSGRWSWVGSEVGAWTKDCRGAGLAYAVVTVAYNTDDMTSEPNFIFEVQGKLYDPRLDSSVGGNGGQRWDDPRTWQWSNNPIVQAYNYERGFYLGDQLVIGKGMSAADLPLAEWKAAMDQCDETIGGETRYRSGFIFTADNGVTHADNLSPVLDACGGALVEMVEGDVPLVGVTQPVVYTITDDDLISDETHTWQAKRSRSELINSVYGSFNDPDKMWELNAYVPAEDENARAADGERHAVQLDFTAVYVGSQSARLAMAALRENRYQASAKVTLRPRWIKLKVGQWIRWQSDLYGERIYRVVGRSLNALAENGARNVVVNLQEVGPGIYDNNVDIPEGPANPIPIPPVRMNFPENFAAAPLQGKEDGTNRLMPIVALSWNDITDLTVNAVYIEYWQESEPDRRVHTTVFKPDRTTIISGLLGETWYIFRATVIADPTRETLWGPERRVQTLKENVPADIDPGEVADIVNDMNKWNNTNIEWGRREIDRINSIISDQTAGDYLDRQSMRTELVAEAGRMRAEYKQLVAVAVSETQAIAVRI